MRECKRRLMVQENKKKLALSAELNAKLKEVKKTLKEKERELQEKESLIEAKYAIKAYSLEDLGYGQTNGGTAQHRKNRAEVLNRLARLGGLSRDQQNEFAWFKANWDAKMAEEHVEEWGNTFAQWMQRILEDTELEKSSFSMFVHDEMRRCFGGQIALQVP